MKGLDAPSEFINAINALNTRQETFYLFTSLNISHLLPRVQSSQNLHPLHARLCHTQTVLRPSSRATPDPRYVIFTILTVVDV